MDATKYAAHEFFSLLHIVRGVDMPNSHHGFLSSWEVFHLEASLKCIGYQDALESLVSWTSGRIKNEGGRKSLILMKIEDNLPCLLIA